MGYKHTFDTIYTHFQCITNNIYGFGRRLLLLYVLPIHHSSTHISTHPYCFYPSKWQVDGSLHKAMWESSFKLQKCLHVWPGFEGMLSLDMAACAACSCSSVGPCLDGGLGCALAGCGTGRCSDGSFSRCPAPASLNLAAVLRFSKNLLSAAAILI